MIFGRAYPIKSAVIIKRQRFSGTVNNYTLTANTGTYTVSGQAAGLLRGRLLAANTGTYTVSGQAANLLRGRLLTASTGSYVVNGQAAALTSSRKLTANTGAYVVNGQAANLTTAKIYNLTANTGTYTVSGQAATFHVGLSLAAAKGTYVLTGLPAQLNYVSTSTAVGGQQWRWLEGQKHVSKTENSPPPKLQDPGLKKSAQILSSAGGHARAAALTKQQRTQIAIKGANARWK